MDLPVTLVKPDSWLLMLRSELSKTGYTKTVSPKYGIPRWSAICCQCTKSENWNNYSPITPNRTLPRILEIPKAENTVFLEVIFNPMEAA